MEFAEVVCPHVALPVVGVLVCALLVFAFGFKSPGQPPSFDFDDKKKIRRTKQKTGRSHTGNGHVPVSVEEVPSKTSAGSKSPRNTAANSTNSSSKNTSPSSTKASPSGKQDAKKVVKRTAVSKTTTDEAKPKAQSAPEVDEEGWMTQVSKKGKKQRGKKDDTDVVDKKPVKEEIPETLAPEVKEVETTPTEPESPPLEKRKKKSRKTSKGTPEEVVSTGGSGEPAQAPVEEQSEEKVIPAAEIEPEPEPQPEIAAESPEEEDVEVVEEVAPKPQKKSKKKEIGADFEIPDVYTKPQVVEPVAPVVKKPAKSPKKNKKDKKQEQQPLEVDVEMEVPKNATPASAVMELSEAMQDIPAVPETSPVETPSQPESASTAQTTENVSFDELGDSWIEAKVKTKKKKARREN